MATAHLADPEVRVIEVDVSPAHYDEWHIDGAGLWNVYGDLKDAEYRLVDTAALERLLERSGIDPGSTVVFYGYAPALGMWLMQLCGHEDACILDCSREAWRAAGHPWSTSVRRPHGGEYRLGGEQHRPSSRSRLGGKQHPPPGHGPGGRPLEGRVRRRAVLAVRRLEAHGRAGTSPRPPTNPSTVSTSRRVVSVRRGAAPRLLLARPRRRRRADHLLHDRGPGGDRVVCLTYLLGRQQVRVYDGSWAEWGRPSDSPVERPEAPPPTNHNPKKERY